MDPKHILYHLIVWYLVFAFGTLIWNPLEWEQNVRLIYITVVMFTVFMHGIKPKDL
jgi:hypothetical protein